MRFISPSLVSATILPALAVLLCAAPAHAAIAAPAAGGALGNSDSANPDSANPDSASPDSPSSDEGAVVEKRGDTRILIYEGDTLEGEVLSPGGAAVTGHVGARHASLVGIRPHFVRELVRLSYDL